MDMLAKEMGWRDRNCVFTLEACACVYSGAIEHEFLACQQGSSCMLNNLVHMRWCLSME